MSSSSTEQYREECLLLDFIFSGSAPRPLPTRISLSMSPTVPSPSDSPNGVSISQNAGEGDKDNFVDIETIGLRRSSRIKHKPERMSAIDPKTTEIKHDNSAIGLLILATSAFIHHGREQLEEFSKAAAHCYQSRVLEYEDYLDRNFDGTRNSTNPLAQIYLTSKANNEVYTLKEMLREPDRVEFLKAMKEEVGSLFEEKIWKLVPRQEMNKYYAKQRSEGKKIERQQIMMI